MPNPAWTRLAGLVVCALSLACRSSGPSALPTERERLDMFTLMLPYELKIQPFTKVKSFNEDDVPDGVLAVVRPLDRFGDPVKAVGLFYFELWTYVNASGERRGERLGYWERMIGSAEEVRLYWTRAQMYEFQLAWTAGADLIRPGRKYVLVATYRPPWDETIQDEYMLDFAAPPEPVAAVPSAGTAAP